MSGGPRPEPSPDPGFAELVAATNYSFLTGASHPAEMVAEEVAETLKGRGVDSELKMMEDLDPAVFHGGFYAACRSWWSVTACWFESPQCTTKKFVTL